MTNWIGVSIVLNIVVYGLVISAQLDEVISIYDVTGDYDIAVIARFKDRTSLNNFIKSILKIPHVIKTVTNVVLNVVKEDFRVKV